jgi:hypothetical protein
MRFKVDYYFTSGNHFVEYFHINKLKPGTKCHAACIEAKEKSFAISSMGYGDYAVVRRLKWWQLF